MTPYITHENLQNSETVHYIYADIQTDYYWSDDFSEQFYIALAQAGFITVTYAQEEALFLLPEMQKSYAVLDFENLHISKKVAKLLRQERYEMRFNTAFSEVLEKIQEAYEPCWMVGEYAVLMQKLASSTHENFSVFSCELFDTQTGALISGEIGYITQGVYTSLSGFSSKESAYTNWGTLQLVLLARHLQKSVRFWNLGHPYMEYKIALGAKVLSRQDFLVWWHS
jgi:Leu/Phe-tRNA-protein transferase